MSTCELDLLVTGLLVPLGPLMQGILETLGLTVAGHLVQGQVKVVPKLLPAQSLLPIHISAACTSFMKWTTNVQQRM
jgi:hypothetical protein